jgi:hypothetical protein
MKFMPPMNCNDNLERYNIAQVVQASSIKFMLCCRDNLQHYRRAAAYLSASSRAERVVCEKQHSSIKVSNNVDANPVEYAYFSAPCG